MFQHVKHAAHELVDKLTGHHHKNESSAKEQLKDMANEQQGSNNEDHVDPVLLPLFNELKDINDQLRALSQQGTVTPHELLPIREKLGDADACYREGRFCVEGMKEDMMVPSGQAVLADLLNDCHEKLRSILERTDYYKVADELRPWHDKLTNILFALKKVDQKPTPMPKDVRDLRKKLAEIDAHYSEARIEVGQSIPEGQAVISDLLQEAHDMVNRILMKSDYYRVDPVLMSVHDRLENVIMGMEGLLTKESVTHGEVSKYTTQLTKLDAMYDQGSFKVKGRSDYEGQSVCAELLNKAHELNQAIQDKIKA